MKKMIPHRRLQFVASGKYLPQRVILPAEMDQLLNLPEGKSEKTSGVRKRHFASPDETNAFMGARALEDALKNAGLSFKDLDALICANGSIEQLIPCTAASTQRELGETESAVACFDVNSTCLSFVTAVDMAASLLETQRYEKIAIVSAEVASVGLNFEHLESACLFGDGAAAFIVQRTPDSQTSHVFQASMETYSSGFEHCQVQAGGARYHPARIGWSDLPKERFLFQMDGKKMFKEVLERMPDFLQRFLDPVQMRITDFQMIVPHQASASGLALMQRRLEVENGRWMNILAEHGNMIAASIPLAFHTAIEAGKIRRGDKVMLLGTSAGFSMGAVALEY